MVAGVVPLNTWLINGASLFGVYPCRCELWRQGGCDPTWCPCSGRLDVWNWPAACCAWVNTPAVAQAAQDAYSASRGWT